jgi:hypothetical protein
MKLNTLNEDEYQILQLLVREFYVALPESLKTYSVFTTHLFSKALQYYGIKTRVLPCRLWCSTLKTKKEFVGGFFNFGDAEKWNGHIICLAGDWLIDAAIYHLNPTFGYQVPKIIAERIFFPPPHIYAQHRLNKKTEFVWYRLPPQTPAIPLVGYEEFMGRYLPTLIAHIDGRLSAQNKETNPAQAVGVIELADDLAEHAIENTADSDSEPVTEHVLAKDTEELSADSGEGDAALHADAELAEAETAEAE